MVNIDKNKRVRVCSNCIKAGTSVTHSRIDRVFKCQLTGEWTEFDLCCKSHKFDPHYGVDKEIKIPPAILSMGDEDVKVPKEVIA